MNWKRAALMLRSGFETTQPAPECGLFVCNVLRRLFTVTQSRQT